MGVIGCGNIGSKVAYKCSKLGMQVICIDPPLAEKGKDSNIPYKPFEAIYACDVITLHVPLTQKGCYATKGLLNTRFFSSLKKKPLLINTSRGEVIDDHALSKAINNKQLKAVILDVWKGEPYINTTLHKEVFLGTPHIAGQSQDAKMHALMKVYKLYCRWRRQEATQDVFTNEATTKDPVYKITCSMQATTSTEDLLQQVTSQAWNLKNIHQQLQKAMLRASSTDYAESFNGLRHQQSKRSEWHHYGVRLLAESRNERQASHQLSLQEALKTLEYLGLKTLTQEQSFKH